MVGIVFDAYLSDIRENFAGSGPGRHRTEQTQQIEVAISPHRQTFTFDDLVHPRFENILFGVDLFQNRIDRKDDFVKLGINQCETVLHIIIDVIELRNLFLNTFSRIVPMLGQIFYRAIHQFRSIGTRIFQLQVGTGEGILKSLLVGIHFL